MKSRIISLAKNFLIAILEIYVITYGKIIWDNNVKSVPASDRDTPI